MGINIPLITLIGKLSPENENYIDLPLLLAVFLLLFAEERNEIF